MSFYETKLTVFVFQTKAEAKLKYSDLLVYSCLSYYQKFDKPVPDTKIAWHTGLTRQTVAAAIQRMTDSGLMRDRHPQPNDRTFIKKKGGGYSYWKCLVSDSEHISVPATMIFSLLLHYHLTNYKCRMSNAYLSSVLGLDNKTVATSVKMLNRLQLLQPESWTIANTLVGDQTLLFKKKGVSSEPIEIKTFTPEPLSFEDIGIKNPHELPKRDLPYCEQRCNSSKNEIMRTAKLLGFPEDIYIELFEKFIEKDGGLNVQWRHDIEEMARARSVESNAA